MKRLLWFVFGSLALIMLAGLLVALRQPKSVGSGPLTLPDGSVVRIVGVTYGTNHVVGPPLARLVARLPAAMRPAFKAVLGHWAALRGSATTPKPRLIVWLGRATNNAPAPNRAGYLIAYLSDGSGFISGERVSVMDWWPNPQQLQFQVFPRRDRVIALNLFYHSPTGGVTRCGSLPFANPRYGTFPQWQPEPLPAARRAGDVAVTLEKLSTGHNNHTDYKGGLGGAWSLNFGTDRKDGANRTVCFVHCHSLTHTNEVWQMVAAEVSDATGNKVATTSTGWGSPDQGYFAFEPGLWTNEAAWKLRCEIKRLKGFAPGETFTFRDVPLGGLNRTNHIGWRTNFNGASVVLDYVLRRAPLTNNSWSSDDMSQVQFTTAGLTNGVHLDLLSARTDAGTNLTCGSWGRSPGCRNYNYRDIPLDAKTADFTFAVQHSRWVEFLVKPEVGPARLEYHPQRDQ